MKSLRLVAPTFILLLLLVVNGWAVDVPPLQISDCQKCHIKELLLIADNGGKHRDAVSCVDCHREHPPRGANAIPACALCHAVQKRDHFAVEGCLGCHPPHTPLLVSYQDVPRVYPACQTCHPEPPAELQEYQSNHSVLDCKACHPQHGKFLECLSCHEPHLSGQTYQDCRQCHQPHSPLKVVYMNNLESAQCASCHVLQGEQLKQTTTKHRLLLCVYCHKTQHKRVPKCETCHFRPHMAGMHEKFPDCVACHVGPHNLVN